MIFQLNELPPALRRQAQLEKEAKARNRAALAAANLEPDPGHAPVAKEEAPGFPAPCRILIHSIRKRLADSDGVSAKAAIDGLVHGGVLEDDSAKFVEEVRYRQTKAEKGDPEETVITLVEI